MPLPNMAAHLQGLPGFLISSLINIGIIAGLFAVIVLPPIERARRRITHARARKTGDT